jgi:hypothetical protein
MPYNPSSDFVGLWRAISGNVEKAQMPGLDFVIQALARAGLMRMVTSATAPTTNQTTTAWFRPSSPSFASEGTLFLWDISLNMYVPATPELFHTMISGGDTSTGGGGGGGGIPEAPNDGVQYGRQSLAWTPVAGSAVIPPGTGVDDMAIISGTAPASPAVGQQWWNGTIMQVWDGAQWKVVGPPTDATGGALQPTTLAFAMSQETQLTIPSDTAWHILPYAASPIVDTGPGWDNTTKKFTPKKAGYYAFSLRAVQSNVGQSGGIAILKNDDGIYDSTVGDLVVAQATVATASWMSITGFAQMNGTTDYVRAFALSQNGIFAACGSSPVYSALRLA